VSEGAGLDDSRPGTAGISHAEPAGQPVKEHRSEIVLALGAVAKDKLAVVGTVILLLAIVITIAAPLISPYGPNEVPDHAERLMPPLSPGFILGTDGQGRDILSRIIWGGRVSIPVAVAPIAVSSVAGLILGLIAGFAGGLLSGFIMRGLDIVFAFPGVLLSVAVATILGSGMMNVMFAMSIVLVPWVARIVYVETVSTLQMEFIEAAKACNAGTMRILFREVLPNAISPVIVFGTTSLGAMIVFAAGLSFLGAGVQPPTADWGIMASDGRSVVALAPWISIVPGTVIVIVAVACNFAGDGLRDALDPRQRTRR
jgi:peptide/nickel transport system permease protein